MGGWIFTLIFILVVLFSVLRAAKEFLTDVINWSNQMLGMKEHRKENNAANANDPREELLREDRQYTQRQDVPMAPTMPGEEVYTATLAQDQAVPVMRTKPRSKAAPASKADAATFVPPDRTPLAATFSNREGALVNLGNRTEVITSQNRHLAREIFEMFQSPDSMQKAITLNEILNRPEDRWA